MVLINDLKEMFWGVALDTGKRYSQVVDQTFHLSMAALEPGSGTGNEYVQVMLQRESSEFLLCSLQQGKIMQQPLDLLFSAGEELSFSLVGKGTVHLTGYVVEDPQGMEDDYSGDEDSDAPELVEMDSELLQPGSKRKAIESARPSKKTKMSQSFGDIEMDDDDEDDDDYDDEDEDEDDNVDSDDDSSDDEDFSEDELTFDEDDEGSDFGGDSDEDEEEEEAAVSPKGKKAVTVTPKGDAGVSKKNKNTPKTPSSESKNNSQKQNATHASTPHPKKKQEAKTPQTPNSATTNGESAKKKKKKNKDGNSSMNQSSASSPEKSSSESTPKSAKKGKAVESPKIATPGKKKVVAGGTVVEDVKVGHGPEAKAGKMVSVYYVGTLSSNNKRFDSCNSGKPFRFRLKGGEVIKGWDNGVEGMKVGGKRKIVVPANQGYGSQRQGPIPPNSSLTFEVELKAVN